LNGSFFTVCLSPAQGSRALLGQYLLHSFDDLGWLIQNLIQLCLQFFYRGCVDIHPALFCLREQLRVSYGLDVRLAQHFHSIRRRSGRHTTEPAELRRADQYVSDTAIGFTRLVLIHQFVNGWSFGNQSVAFFLRSAPDGGRTPSCASYRTVRGRDEG